MSDICKVVAVSACNDVTDRRRGEVRRQNKGVSTAVRIEESFASVGRVVAQRGFSTGRRTRPGRLAAHPQRATDDCPCAEGPGTVASVTGYLEVNCVSGIDAACGSN